MQVLAIDIGGTKTAVAIVADDQLIAERRWATDVAAGAVGVQASIADHAGELLSQHQVEVCGIGFGGQFDFARQQVRRSVHVPGWEGLHLGEWVEDTLGLPAIADNDANVAALGEARFGAGADCDVLVYCTISTGIGGSFVVHGAVQRGAHSLAAEFGHLTLVPHGPLCGCGLHGCAERMLSGLWLEREHHRSADELLRDPEFFAQYTEQLAELLQQITMVLDPERIILGGGIGASSPQLADAVHQLLVARLASWQRPAPQVVMAALGGRSVLIGAGVLAREWHERSG